MNYIDSVTDSYLSMLTSLARDHSSLTISSWSRMTRRRTFIVNQLQDLAVDNAGQQAVAARAEIPDEVQRSLRR